MRILLFAKKSDLKDIGGPTGYMYNISEYLKIHPSDEIFFLPERRLERTIWGNIVTSIFLIFVKLFSFSKRLENMLALYSMFFRHEYYSKKTIDYLNSFDYIHYHYAPYFLTTFKKNKVTAKKIITVHSPEPYTFESLEMAGLGRLSKKHKWIENFFLKREIQIFDYCDYVMFPVPEAKEPYIENALYRDKLVEIDNKLFYVPTCLNSTDKIEGITNRLSEFSIDPNALKVCYIGRHNKIKGYDFLQETAKRLWKEGINTYFIIGGKEGPYYGLKNDKWIELGWVKTPYLLNEVDVFVLPNQQTYFDLILLETLRQGTPVILSRTGGNKWFEKFGLEGMLFFEYGNYDDIIIQIKKIMMLKKLNKLDKIKENNRTFIRDNFNMASYISQYINTLSSLSPTTHNG